MKTAKSHYCSICKSSIKLLAILVFCFLAACSRQNNTKQILSTENQFQISESAININTAAEIDLEKLPNIGAATAREIIEHRNEFGSFAKPEHVILVRGISDERFREIRHLIKVE